MISALIRALTPPLDYTSTEEANILKRFVSTRTSHVVGTDSTVGQPSATSPNTLTIFKIVTLMLMYSHMSWNLLVRVVCTFIIFKKDANYILFQTLHLGKSKLKKKQNHYMSETEEKGVLQMGKQNWATFAIAWERSSRWRKISTNLTNEEVRRVVVSLAAARVPNPVPLRCTSTFPVLGSTK